MAVPQRNIGERREGARWLLLIHQIPPKPDYLRVKIGRRLRAVGAVAIKNSVYVLPASGPLGESLAKVAREILLRGGDAAVCEARFVGGLSDEAVENLFREVRDADYAAISDEAKRLARVVRPGSAMDDPRRRAALRRLRTLKRRFEVAASGDIFGARGRDAAAGILSLLEDRLQGVEIASEPGVDPPEPPRGATWVTRAGVMVDRIASAWLIRRFIDPAARFRFVAGRGRRVARGERCFDMAGAEFTHQGGRCTFETLVERFRIRDPALTPIAEIVHDIDLEDSRYRRAEAGVSPG